MIKTKAYPMAPLSGVSYDPIWPDGPFIGTVPRDFRLQVFYKVFPQAPDYTTGINNTNGTGGKICRRCRWYRWWTLTCEYLREFSGKNQNDPSVIFKGLEEADSWKKPEAKNLVSLSLKIAAI